MLLPGKNVDEKVIVSEPSLGLLDHLLERAHEHINGSIVCYATKNGPTAEVGARVGMESSANVRYILSGDRNSRLLAWLHNYLKNDAGQIKRWKNATLKFTIKRATSFYDGEWALKNPSDGMGICCGQKRCFYDDEKGLSFLKFRRQLA